MHYSTIRTELSDGIALITLDRPDRMNALNTQMRAELVDALKTLGAKARVVVITGAGRAFCSGQDLGDAASMAKVDLERVLRDEYAPMLSAVVDCPVPVIAAVNGAAAGAGASLALSCDVVIAAQSATFVQAFVKIGLIPDAGATHVLPRVIGQARAMGAALFAEPVSAEAAAAQGMIWEAVPDEDFEAQWRKRATFLANGPTTAFAGVKRAIRASSQNTLEAQFELEAHIQGDCGRSGDFKEGVLAFLEKRAPRFTGQ